MSYDYFNSPLQRILRQAREHDAYVIAHPDEFTREEVASAIHSEYQRSMMQVRDILRYGD